MSAERYIIRQRKFYLYRRTVFDEAHPQLTTPEISGCQPADNAALRTENEARTPFPPSISLEYRRIYNQLSNDLKK